MFLSARHTLQLLACAAGFALAAPMVLPSAEVAPPKTALAVKMSPLQLDRVRNFAPAKPALGLSSTTPLPVAGAMVYVPLHLEFRDAASRLRFRPPQGITIFHEFDRFADALLDVRFKQNIDDLLAMPGLVWADAVLDEVRVIPPPPIIAASAEKKLRASEEIVRGGIDGLTGKGTIIAVIDDGVDFQHKDFITYDAQGQPTSRILYYWDTFAQPSAPASSISSHVGSPAPFSYPNGMPIGMIYRQEEITAELRRPTGKITVEGYHGTSCLGIAAGNGNARADKKYIGVAPEADIIAVRIGRKGPWSQYLLGAICVWIDAKAGPRPVVLSCSFGHVQTGGRDGCTVMERQLDARFGTARVGRAICIAAGNEGDGHRFHAEVTFQGEEAKGIIPWTAQHYEKEQARVSVYVQTDTPDDIQVAVKAVPEPVVYRYHHPLSGALVIEFALQGGGKSSSGNLSIWSASRKKLKANAYIDSEPWLLGAFEGPAVSALGRMRTPGSMNNAITVGSYDFNALDDRIDKVLVTGYKQALKLNDLSAYSSRGYNRLGIIKPTIAAPGQFFLAPASKLLWTMGSPGFTKELQETQDREYCRFNGTSAATPYTAGIVALIFQKKADLTFGELKALLRTQATTDGITGRTPNPGWGYGRLDYAAVQAVLKAVR